MQTIEIDRSMFPNVSVYRYADPEGAGRLGYVEPDDKSWIVYIGLDGRARFFPDRDNDGRVQHSGFGSQWSSPADELLSFVRRWLDGPPVHAPGSMAAGSATEDRAIDRWVSGMRDRMKRLMGYKLGELGSDAGGILEVLRVLAANVVPFELRPDIDRD